MAALALSITTLLGASVDGALAQDTPTTEGSVTEGVWQLDYTSLGYGTVHQPTLADDLIELQVPQIDGLQPTRFNGSLTAASTKSAAHVTVYVDGEPIEELTLEAGQTIVLDVDLPGTASSIGIAGRLSDSSQLECQVGTTTVELRDPHLTYSGIPLSPTGPEDFLPPALTKLTIAIEGRDPLTDQAVLDLTTELARRYADSFVIDVVAVSPGQILDPPAHPFERTVRITPSGQGAEMVSGSAFSSLTISNSRPAGAAMIVATPPPRIGPDDNGLLLLFPHLARTTTAEGPGHASLPIVISQPTLGGPHGDLVARVGGRITPLSGGLPQSVTISMWADHRLLATTEIGESGRFDLEEEIDNELLGRETVLTISADASKATDDRCTDGQPLRLELDQGSWIRADPGQHLLPGFSRFPQGLIPDHQVFIGSTVDDLEAAAGMEALLQRMSENPLVPRTAQNGDDPQGASLIVGSLDDQLAGEGISAASEKVVGAFDITTSRPSAVLHTTTVGTGDALVLLSLERGAQARLVALVRESGFVALQGSAVGLFDETLVPGQVAPIDSPPLLPGLGPDGVDGLSPSTTGQLFMYGLLGAAAVMGLAVALGPIRQLMKR
ncbi:MAG: hypothetical protein GY698_01520 [Actinomycetia bacterium]|nr:hypothetical protein [Actinomycetes bacterium]